MAISLKSLYDQVQAIKTSGLSITSKKLSGNPCYIEFSDGLKINWGTGYSFAISFTNTNYAILCGNVVGSTNAYDNAVTAKRVNGYSCHIKYTYPFLAIGYLISNRITSLLEVLL